MAMIAGETPPRHLRRVIIALLLTSYVHACSCRGMSMDDYVNAKPFIGVVDTVIYGVTESECSSAHETRVRVIVPLQSGKAINDTLTFSCANRSCGDCARGCGAPGARVLETGSPIICGQGFGVDTAHRGKLNALARRWNTSLGILEGTCDPASLQHDLSMMCECEPAACITHPAVCRAKPGYGYCVINCSSELLDTEAQCNAATSQCTWQRGVGRTSSCIERSCSSFSTRSSCQTSKRCAWRANGSDDSGGGGECRLLACWEASVEPCPQHCTADEATQRLIRGAHWCKAKRCHELDTPTLCTEHGDVVCSWDETSRSCHPKSCHSISKRTQCFRADNCTWRLEQCIAALRYDLLCSAISTRSECRDHGLRCAWAGDKCRDQCDTGNATECGEQVGCRWADACTALPCSDAHSERACLTTDACEWSNNGGSDALYQCVKVRCQALPAVRCPHDRCALSPSNLCGPKHCRARSTLADCIPDAHGPHRRCTWDAASAQCDVTDCASFSPVTYDGCDRASVFCRSTRTSTESVCSLRPCADFAHSPTLCPAPWCSMSEVKWLPGRFTCRDVACREVATERDCMIQRHDRCAWDASEARCVRTCEVAKSEAACTANPECQWKSGRCGDRPCNQYTDAAQCKITRAGRCGWSSEWCQRRNICREASNPLSCDPDECTLLNDGFARCKQRACEMLQVADDCRDRAPQCAWSRVWGCSTTPCRDHTTAAACDAALCSRVTENGRLVRCEGGDEGNAAAVPAHLLFVPLMLMVCSAVVCVAFLFGRRQRGFWRHLTGRR
jgi:hypothetical protein